MARSRRDLVNLGEISPISARSRQSRRDLGKNFARELIQFAWAAFSGVCFPIVMPGLPLRAMPVLWSVNVVNCGCAMLARAAGTPSN